MTDAVNAICAVLFLILFGGMFYALEMQHAKERRDLYRLIKADILTDFTSNESTTLPKGRNPILENIRRSMGQDKED